MANFFDQFDGEAGRSPNFFDQFDPAPPKPETTTMGALPELVRGIPAGATAGFGMVLQGVAGLQTRDAQQNAAIGIAAANDAIATREATIAEMQAKREAERNPAIAARYERAAARMAGEIADLRSQIGSLSEPGTATGERGAYKLGERVIEGSRGILPARPGYEDSTARMLGEGLGSTIPLAAGALVPGAGSLLAGGMGVAMGAGEATGRAVDANATEEQIGLAAGRGAIVGSTELAPIEVMLGRLPLPFRGVVGDLVAKYGGDRVASAVTRAGEGAIVEALQEGGAAAAQNLIEQQVYNPDKPILDGVAGEAALGGGVGGIIGGVAGVLAPGRRRSGAVDEDEQPEQPLVAPDALFSPDVEQAAERAAFSAGADLVAAGVPADVVAEMERRGFATDGRITRTGFTNYLDAYNAHESSPKPEPVSPAEAPASRPAPADPFAILGAQPDQVALLMGAGYEARDIAAMSAAERADALQEAADTGAQPVDIAAARTALSAVVDTSLPDDPRLTVADRISPIPNDLIAQGRATIEAAQAAPLALPAPPMAGAPALVDPAALPRSAAQEAMDSTGGALSQQRALNAALDEQALGGLDAQRALAGRMKAQQEREAAEPAGLLPPPVIVTPPPAQPQDEGDRKTSRQRAQERMVLPFEDRAQIEGYSDKSMILRGVTREEGRAMFDGFGRGVPIWNEKEQGFVFSTPRRMDVQARLNEAMKPRALPAPPMVTPAPADPLRSVQAGGAPGATFGPDPVTVRATEGQGLTPGLRPASMPEPAASTVPAAEPEPEVAPVSQSPAPSSVATGETPRQDGDSAGEIEAQSPASQPAPRPMQGRAPTPQRVVTPTGQEVDVTYEAVPLDSLKAATGDLQPRDRAGRKSSDDQIAEIVANFDPERLMPAREADRGTPIVGQDDIVESGNGRVAAIRIVREQRPEAYAAYLDAMRAAGFDLADGDVLVARRTSDLTPDQRREFVVGSNAPAVAQMSSTELAQADVGAMTPDVMDRLNPALPPSAAGNREFVRSFMAKLPAAARGAMVDKDGALNADGVRRINAAVFASAYGDRDLIARMSESTDDAAKGALQAMVRVAPKWARMRSDVRDGAIRPEFDLTPYLLDALRLVTRAREDAATQGRPVGQLIREALVQADIFSGDVDPRTKAMVSLFYRSDEFKTARGVDALADAMSYVVDEVRSAGSAEAGLFGDEARANPEDAINAARRRVERERDEGGTGSLFDPDQGRGGDRAGAGADGAGAQGRRGDDPVTQDAGAGAGEAGGVTLPAGTRLEAGAGSLSGFQRVVRADGVPVGGWRATADEAAQSARQDTARRKREHPTWAEFVGALKEGKGRDFDVLPPMALALTDAGLPETTAAADFNQGRIARAAAWAAVDAAHRRRISGDQTPPATRAAAPAPSPSRPTDPMSDAAREWWKALPYDDRARELEEVGLNPKRAKGGWGFISKTDRARILAQNIPENMRDATSAPPANAERGVVREQRTQDRRNGAADGEVTPEQWSALQGYVEAVAPGVSLSREFGRPDRQGAFVASRGARSIVVSAMAQDPMGTVRHEAIHALRNMGVFSDAEWAALERAARARWMKRYDIAGRYGDLDAEAQLEEAIAEAFADGMSGSKVEPGPVRAALRRIAAFIEAVGNWARGLGFRTAADVFAAVEEGDMGSRAQRDGAPARSAALAAATDAQMSGAADADALADIANYYTRERRTVAPGPFQTYEVRTSHELLSMFKPRNWSMLADAKNWNEVGLALRRWGADSMIDVRRQQRAVEEARGAPLPLTQDVYHHQSLYVGRTGERLQALYEGPVREITRLIRDEKLDHAVIDGYLTAMHAEERNAHVASLYEIDQPDHDFVKAIADPSIVGGSGMSANEARKIIRDTRASPKAAAYERAARLTRKMLDDSLDLQVAAGLVSQDAADAMRATYRNYVPLRGFENEEADGGPGIGRGFDIRGAESRRVVGRGSRSDSPLAYAFSQAANAIIRSEKNRVGKAMLRLVNSNPNPNAWSVMRPKITKADWQAEGLDWDTLSHGEKVKHLKKSRVMAIDPQTGLPVMMTKTQVKEQRQAPSRMADNVLIVKVGGEEVAITLENRDVAAAMKNLHPEAGSMIVRGVGAITRLMAALNTSWNIEWFGTNMLRDMTAAGIQISDEKRSGLLRDMAKNWPQAMRGAFQHNAGVGSGAWKDLAEDFAMQGGKVSYIDFRGVEAFKDLIKDSASASKLKRMLAAGSNGILDGIEVITSTGENAIRIAAYKAMLDRGVSKSKAASVARELTVNFNRRGTATPTINAFFMFFNAAVQGNIRLAQSVARSRFTRRALVGLGALGFMEAMLGALDDDEYRKVDGYIRERNMVFMLEPLGLGEKGEYVKLPLPYGFNVFKTMGTEAGRVMLLGEDAEVAAMNVVGAMANSFNPLGTENLHQLLLPSFLRPGIEIAENRNFFGSAIAPRYPNDLRPASEQYFPNVSPWARDFAAWLNGATGGNEFREGWMSLSPEHIEHLIQAYAGGVGRLAMNTRRTFEAFAAGDAPEVERAPFVRQLYGRTVGEMPTWRAYRAISQEAAGLRYEIEGFVKSGRPEDARAARDRDPTMTRLMEFVRTNDRMIADLRKREREVMASAIPDEMKDERVAQIRERSYEIQRRVVERFDAARRAAAGE